MGFLLKLSLAVFYAALGGLIFLYPQQTQDYVATRYTGLVQSCEKLSENSFLPTSTSISKLPLNAFRAIGFALGLIGILALFSMRKCFIFLSVIAVMVGGLLHCPCTEIEGIEKTAQLKCFMALFAILCATLAYPTCSSKEKIGDKVKTD